MALFWRVWTAVMLVDFVVLAIFVGLATLQFDRIHSDLLGKRLIVLGDRTAAPFEAAARIGLPLSSVRNADALLERARQTDNAILAIHVFDAAERIVHSTVPSPPPAISREAATARRSAQLRPWHVEATEGFLSGLDIATPEGSTAGGIVIVYPDSENVTRVWAMGAELAVVAGGILLGGGAAGALLLFLGLARQITVFAAIDDAIAGFERDAWRAVAAGERLQARTSESTELRSLLDAAESRYRAIGRALPTTREPER